MSDFFINSIQTINQFISAGIAITAFSLLLYVLSFNLRDRVTRTFAFILICVVIVFVGDTIASVTSSAGEMEFWLRIQWIGIIFLPVTYLHFSDALLATTGRPSRGRRRFAYRLGYLIGIGFLIALPTNLLVGPLVQNIEPAPHLERTWLTWVFSALYLLGVTAAWINFYRALQRTVTSASRRRMQYLLLGALAPALGSYPYLLFGSTLAEGHPGLFWIAATLSNLTVSVLLVLMAYSVAFFGVSWPDRVVKRRLFKWLMRGPVTASLVLVLTTLVRRAGLRMDNPYSAAVPITMVGSLLLIQHLITLLAPIWERRIFHGGDRLNMTFIQTLEDRLLTSGDMQQFLESILAAVCDRLQAARAFIVSFNSSGLDMVVTIGSSTELDEEFSESILQLVAENGFGTDLFSWGSYWLVPLFGEKDDQKQLLGLMGVQKSPGLNIDEEQREPLFFLAHRAALALEERILQQQVFSSLESLTPQIDLIQQLRAAARYDGTSVLTSPDETLENHNVTKLVKDALTHYWGGPKLTQSPLMGLQIVKRALEDHEGVPANALRSILHEAIEQTKPEGERRFTGEWILYNILEMKFMEGRKVREIAMRLAMSEADLYRKQRVAIEAVAAAIVEMEQKVREENNHKQGEPSFDSGIDSIH